MRQVGDGLDLVVGASDPLFGSFVEQRREAYDTQSPRDLSL